MTHLFEVRVVQNTEAYPLWKISSTELIDCDIYCIVNSKIKKFQLVSTSTTEEVLFVYEIHFHRAVSRIMLCRMFPACNVEPIRQVPHVRMLVYYDSQDNCYRPYDDSSM